MARIKINKDKNYTIISNHALQNKRMSNKAKGLFAMMWSLPEDWDYSIKGLETLSTDGEKSIRSQLKELEEHGYLIREQKKDKGRFSNVDYSLFEFPEVESKENTDFSPSASFRQAEKGQAQKDLQQSTKEQSTKELKYTTEKIQSKNKFNNFNQREYDFDELEKRMLK